MRQCAAKKKKRMPKKERNLKQEGIEEKFVFMRGGIKSFIETSSTALRVLYVCCLYQKVSGLII